MIRSVKVLLAALACVSLCASLHAAPGKRKPSGKSSKSAPAQSASYGKYRKSPYVGAMSVDVGTGRVIFSRNADSLAYPASVTKLMTAFLVLDEIKSGRLSYSDMVIASAPKTALDRHLRQPSCLGLRGGEAMTVEEMLKAIMVKSANDAAVFLAEKCAGTMERFVERMNKKALQLGMNSTKFHNPNGLPPMRGTTGFNVSTCRDLAKMSIALLRTHPEILKYTSIKIYTANLPNGTAVRFKNHNNVMVKNALKIINPDGTEAVDGLKTGYIDAGGSSVAITAKRNGKRVVAIVLGSSSAAERDKAARECLSDALDAVTL